MVQGGVALLTDVPVRGATLSGSEGGCLPGGPGDGVGGGPSPADEVASAGSGRGRVVTSWSGAPAAGGEGPALRAGGQR